MKMLLFKKIWRDYNILTPSPPRYSTVYNKYNNIRFDPRVTDRNCSNYTNGAGGSDRNIIVIVPIGITYYVSIFKTFKFT